MDYKTLLPAEKAEHLKELWRICYIKAFGASNILAVFKKLHNRVIEFGTTRNIHINRDILARRIIDNRSRFVLLPEDPFKRFWNILIIFLLFYVATYVPYDICFAPNEGTGFNNLKIFDLLVDFLFFIDIFVNFLSSYEDDKGLPVIKLKSVSLNYATGWFPIDFVACFPVQLIESSLDGGGK
jgi:hypothetical protein